MLYNNCTDENKIETEIVPTVVERYLTVYKGIPVYVINTTDSCRWEYFGLTKSAAIQGAQAAVAAGIVKNRAISNITIDEHSNLTVTTSYKDVHTVKARAVRVEGTVWRVECEKNDTVTTFEVAG